MPDLQDELMKRQLALYSPDPETVRALQDAWEPKYRHQDWVDNLQAKIGLGGTDQPPSPSSPYPFKPEPFVNNPIAQRFLHGILNVAPRSVDKMNGIIVGPNNGVVEVLKDAGFRPDQYPYTNLNGLTDTWSGEVSINPKLSDRPQDMLGTIIHELTHKYGYHESDARRIGNMWHTQQMREQLQRVAPVGKD